MNQTLQSLTRLAARFRDQRDWKQFHNPKDLAIALVVEAGELLELMQWKSGEQLSAKLRKNRDALADELSDVLYFVLMLAHDQQIDLPAAFRRKMRKNAIKYPVRKSRGRSDKYTEL